MRLVFALIPWRFALLSCAVYLAFIVVLGFVGVASIVLLAVKKHGVLIVYPRWFWLTLNTGVFLAASVIAWKISAPPHWPR